MTTPTFTVVGVRVEPHAIVPTLVFGLHLDESPGHVALRCQLRVEPERRRYTISEEDRLIELFGEASRWGQTLKPFLWTEVTLAVRPPADGMIELSVPCTYDFEVIAARYLHSLDDGEVPLRFLFSGTLFSSVGEGVRLTQIPWDREATFRLPVRVWRDAMDRYFPNSGWLRLRRETIDALLEIKGRNALSSWDEVIASLLPCVTKERPCSSTLAR